MYRARQFFGGLSARGDNEDDHEMVFLLTAAQRDLFRRMAPNDQRHAIRVCRSLQNAGYDCPDLLAAALLHDVGKANGHIRLWQRAIIVVLSRLAPSLLSWLARGKHPENAPQWRKPFLINQLHPEVGARWASEAGCSPLTVALIQRHQEAIQRVENEQDRLLIALQKADSVN